jgi:Fic family protein
VPPAPAEMPDRLDDLEEFMVAPPAMPRLVQAGLIHHQFEAIHPFGDGNGRVGRLLIPLFLLQTKVLRTPLLYLSAYFERKRTEYYDRLHAVHTDGDYDGWLAFFLRGVAVQADEAAAAAGRIADLYQRYRDELTKVNATATALALLDSLFENPYVTIPQAQRTLDSSFPTVQRAIEKYLLPAGVLEHQAGTSHPRVYVAREIFKAIQADS